MGESSWTTRRNLAVIPLLFLMLVKTMEPTQDADEYNVEVLITAQLVDKCADYIKTFYHIFFFNAKRKILLLNENRVLSFPH